MRIILYGHGGSRNHGCEAIVRSTIEMLGVDVDTYTTDICGDETYQLDNITKLHKMHSTAESLSVHLFTAIARRAFNQYGPMIRFEYQDLLKMQNNIMVSVGGDNYCNGHPFRYMEANKCLSKKNKTVLWGCSITPELLKNKVILEDMNRYSLIITRESLTYDAIMKANVKTKVLLLPDPAFTLQPKEVLLPEGFEKGNMVGINLSPLVENASGTNNLALEGVEGIIDYILSKTCYKIILIPHVVWKKNDDLASLKPLYEKYKDSGRIILADPEKKLNCCELKYIISKCSLMVAARTHASIAAYSSCVPTLVLGYSVKSRGIARDIFGQEDRYVVSVQGIQDSDSIVEAFKWIDYNKSEIRMNLETIMPEYISRAYSAGKELLSLA